MLICSKGQCVFHFPTFGKGNHVVVMDWVTITLVSEAGMIYLSAFQLSTEDKGEGEVWRGLQGQKKRRVGEGDREKQDLYPDGNVETRVGAVAGKECPQWRLFINSCSSTALKCKGLESIPSAPSLGGAGVPAREQLHTGSCTVWGLNISYCDCIWLWGSQRGFFSFLQLLVHQ